MMRHPFSLILTHRPSVFDQIEMLIKIATLFSDLFPLTRGRIVVRFCQYDLVVINHETIKMVAFQRHDVRTVASK